MKIKFTTLPRLGNRLVGPVVKASASRAADLGSIPVFDVDHVLGQVFPVTLRLVIQLLPWHYRTRAGTGRSVSEYCNLVRWIV